MFTARAAIAIAALAGAFACGGTQTQDTGQGTTSGAGSGGSGDTGDTTTKPEPRPGHPSNDLVPRTVFFGNPDKTAAQISPDGTRVSFLAPVDDLLNVWVAPKGDLDAAKPVTKDQTRPVRRYFWAFTNKHIIYSQDTGGDENWHIYSVDLETGKTIDLTPIDGIAARVTAISHKFPQKVIIGINDRNEQLHDLYRIDITTGEKVLMQQNEGFVGFDVDDDFDVRLATRLTPDGGAEMLRHNRKGEWETFVKIPQQDSLTTRFIGFDGTGNRGYLWDSRGRNTGALVSIDMKSGETQVIAEDERADGGGVFLHPTDKTVLAVSFPYLKQDWRVLDESIQPDFDALEKVADGELAIVDTTLDMKAWLVAFYGDDRPTRYYRWDREANEATFLFTDREALEELDLASMEPVVIKARDGLDLVSYLSLPPASDPDGDARPAEPQPMVLLVHGGPWGRDSWGYNPLHQLLANRGYAVLSVNFRGSTGFGKAFVNAGDRQWGYKMHDDLIDAVDWAVKNGVAAKDRVCIMGGSYGGYATLAGLTFTPETFACGVDIVGPSNIITLLEAIPPYWKPMVDMFKTRVGDWTTEEGKAMLLDRSPLTHVEEIVRPLLIGQGANDPRVKQSESDQIVDAMMKGDIPVTYVLFPDEGHGFARPANNLAFFAVAEAFLSAYLGGHYQPMTPADFEGSSITIPTGREYIPGLPDTVGRATSR